VRRLSRRQRLLAAVLVAPVGLGLGFALGFRRSPGSGKSPVEVQAAGRTDSTDSGDELLPGPETSPTPADPSSNSSSSTSSTKPPKPTTTTTTAPTTTTTAPPTTTTTAPVACAPAAPLYSLALLRRPDGNGWSGGANPALEHTVDGGQTWTAACLPADAVPGPGGIYGIAFTADGTHGWATGGSGQRPVVFRTVDGGDQRLAAALPAGLTGGLGSVAFADDRRGWTVGSLAGNGPANAVGGYVLATTDGGLTWATQPVPTTVARLNRIVVVDATHGWAVGVASDGKPALIATTDGGATWTSQTLPPGIQSLRDVGFVDAQRGWAVGGLPAEPGKDSQGVVLTTGDGGATWTQ
jgi:hypothetical protein